MSVIDPRLVPRALPEVDTRSFELFGQTFYGAMQDREFVPLGGMHDGGAEGFDAPPLHEPEMFEEAATGRFLQVSKEANPRSKVRKTVRRLRQFGREPKTLAYVTSQLVPDIDKEETLLSKELGCRIDIRDARYIEININSAPAIQQAFRSYLEPSIEYLYKPGVADIGARAEEYTDRTLAVFLRQEVENRRDKTGLLESVADSLILWALGDTDPDKKRFMTRTQILDRIIETLPAANQFMKGVLDDRLEIMVAKDAPGGRQIRWYRRQDQFCLPYETRQIVGAENAADDMLKLQVSCVMEDRLTEIKEEGDEVDDIRAVVVTTCHSTLERVFERQGLNMALFITNGTEDDELYTDVEDIVSKVVDRTDVPAGAKGRVRLYALKVLRGTFYRSSEVERTYLRKLSRTYVLLLTLKNEPRIVEYFRTLATTFRLYVGTDLLIRALSEQYLTPDNRTTVNLLALLVEAGSELVLTETTVKEVSTHLRAQIWEFENHYGHVESKIPLELVEYIDRLIIRAYLYSRLAPADGIAPPRSWSDYISQFATYNDVRANRAAPELAAYLVRKFKMTYEPNERTSEGIDEEELQRLTDRILEAKQQNGYAKAEREILARNDALHTLRIFRRRLQEDEHSPANRWGYQTWWLTQDGKVRKAGAEVVARRAGAPFMMRPEFLLSYISFAPDLKKVRDSFERIFPTALGVRLSARLSGDVFDKTMEQATEAVRYDEARAGAIITTLTNKLKGDAMKRYEITWDPAV
ncbi:hypothetical protein [Aureimonas psammosilenae]|uniref:hypothetical protein n=1 Tax=Aureimonas psammosilenae TaxID=2495496 RepID=UPI00126069D7|nr:hypothetical protein [Aureimonas psammosilenae]